MQVVEKVDPTAENSAEVIVYKIEVPANRYANTVEFHVERMS